jgi:hypothetical protein
MNLSIDQHKWFYFYKGFIYANRPTPIHARIYNKGLIESGDFTICGAE